MKPTVFLTLLLFASTAIAEETLNTVDIKFENELQPTTDAGVGPGMDFVRDGAYLYMLQERHLAVLSVEDPARPTVIGKLEDVGNLRQIVVRGNVAYITAREDGLFVVDVSDRTNPKFLSHYDTIEFATGIALKDQYAFVAQRWFGVEIIDISNPAKLRHVSVVRVGEAQSCPFFAGQTKLPNGFNTAIDFKVTLKFPNGSSMVVVPGPGNGILLEGEKGRIYVNRARLTGKPIEELTKNDRDRLGEAVVRLYGGRSIDPFGVTTDAANTGRDQATVEHMRNLFDCVKDRSQPVSDVFTHHRSVSSCHLCNIAMLLRRKLRWDANNEDFVGDEQASALVARPQRTPYTIEA